MKSKLIRLVNMPAGMSQNDDFLLEEDELSINYRWAAIIKAIFYYR